MPTLSLLTAAKKGAEIVPATMQGPHDRWFTVLLYEDRHGEIHTISLMDAALEDQHLKNALQQMHDILTVAGAVQAVMVTPIWKALARPNVRARDCEDREEFLMATSVTRDETRVELAKVLRSETRIPRLAPWDQAYEGLEVGGSIADVLRASIELGERT